MDTKTFFQAVRDVFIKYGFKNNQKTFWIIYKEVTVIVCIMKARFCDAYNFHYGFTINSLHQNEKGSPSINFVDNVILNTCVNQKLECDFYIDKYNEQSLADELKEMINRYIEPFKEDAFNYIKNARFIPGSSFNLSKEACAFMGIVAWQDDSEYFYRVLVEDLMIFCSPYQIIKSTLPSFYPVSKLVTYRLIEGMIEYRLNDVKKEGRGLTTKQKNALVKIYNDLRGAETQDVWSEEKMGKHRFWKSIRKQAKKIIKSLNEGIRTPLNQTI